MNKFLDKQFLDQYKNDGIQESYDQAKALVYIILFMDLVMLLLIPIMANTVLKVFLIIVFLSGFLLLYLIRRSRYSLSGLIFIIILSVIFSTMLFTAEYRYYYEVYMLTAMQLLVMTISLLITTSRIHVMIPMLSGGAGVFYIYFFRAVPAMLYGEAPGIDDYVISLVIILFSGFIIMGTNIRNRSLLARTESELKLNREKRKAMEQIIAGMESDFNTGDRLISSSAQVSSYVDQIRSSLESIRDEMNTLSISVIRLNEASGSIRTSSDNVSRAVDDQSAIIEESSSAVTQMAISIDNITKTANERKKVVEQLSEGSREAGEAIESASESMLTLRSLIASMEEINSVINGIAEQTSLLAMNAAIEAAHAGEAGKGFAVVAEEVRKLSENSTDNVQLISKQLQDLNDSITVAGEMNLNASKAYDSISSDIINVVSGMDEIIQGVNELSSGTAEINSGTSQSVNSTTTVKDGVTIVNTKINDISDAISGLDRASSSVLSSVEDTIRKLTMVMNEAESMKDIGRKNAENLKTLGEKISSV